MRRLLLIGCLLLAGIGCASRPVGAAQRLYPNGVISKQVAGLDLSRRTIRRAVLPEIALWQSRDSNYNISIGGSPPPPFSGPGDIVSGALDFWSPYECYSFAFTGNIADVYAPGDA